MGRLFIAVLDEERFLCRFQNHVLLGNPEVCERPGSQQPIDRIEKGELEELLLEYRTMPIHRALKKEAP